MIGLPLAAGASGKTNRRLIGTVAKASVIGGTKLGQNAQVYLRHGKTGKELLYRMPHWKRGIFRRIKADTKTFGKYINKVNRGRSLDFAFRNLNFKLRGGSARVSKGRYFLPLPLNLQKLFNLPLGLSAESVSDLFSDKSPEKELPTAALSHLAHLTRAKSLKMGGDKLTATFDQEGRTIERSFWQQGGDTHLKTVVTRNARKKHEQTTTTTFHSNGSVTKTIRYAASTNKREGKLSKLMRKIGWFLDKGEEAELSLHRNAITGALTLKTSRTGGDGDQVAKVSYDVKPWTDGWFLDVAK